MPLGTPSHDYKRTKRPARYHFSDLRAPNVAKDKRRRGRQPLRLGLCSGRGIRQDIYQLFRQLSLAVNRIPFLTASPSVTFTTKPEIRKESTQSQFCGIRKRIQSSPTSPPRLSKCLTVASTVLLRTRT